LSETAKTVVEKQALPLPGRKKKKREDRGGGTHFDKKKWIGKKKRVLEFGEITKLKEARKGGDKKGGTRLLGQGENARKGCRRIYRRGNKKTREFSSFLNKGEEAKKGNLQKCEGG